MDFEAAISTLTDPKAVVRQLRDSLRGMEPDLAVVFVSHHFDPEFDDLLSRLRDAVNPRNLIGCTGESIVGPDREVESAPAVSIWTARMPGVRILPFVVDQDDVTRLDEASAWQEHLGVAAREKPGIIILPDPFSIDIQRCIDRLDEAYPDAQIVGGLASGATAPKQNRLFINDQVLRQGMVGVTLSGPITMETVVSQGCRAVGERFVITRAEQNVIFELRGQPALEVIRGVYESAPAPDRALMQGGLHIGTAVDEHRGTFGPGDFLIRNLMGVVNDDAIAIGALIRPGQTVQFHVRDAKAADEDMKQLLKMKLDAMDETPGGGLLFTCNGRGSRLFGAPNHDISLINRYAKDCKVAGFFAAGEIGPVGSKTFIHGLTSSLILFQEPTPGGAHARAVQ